MRSGMKQKGANIRGSKEEHAEGSEESKGGLDTCSMQRRYLRHQKGPTRAIVLRKTLLFAFLPLKTYVR